jgi:hypothetical protein
MFGIMAGTVERCSPCVIVDDDVEYDVEYDLEDSA